MVGPERLSKGAPARRSTRGYQEASSLRSSRGSVTVET